VGGVRCPSVTGIFSFGVFTDDEPVERRGGGGEGGKGGGGTAQNPGWAEVGVLLEGLAESETEAPE